MTKLEMLYEKLEKFDDKFLNAQNVEECTRLCDEYDDLKQQIEEQIKLENQRQDVLRRIEENSNKSLTTKIKKVINKPLADFLLNATAENFTSDSGIKFRKRISPILRPFIKLSTLSPVVVHNYPKLPKNEPFIFASAHNYPKEINATLGSLDRNAYVLLGATDQIKHNSLLYMAWINGMYYVNRFDSKSRRDTIDKEERLIRSGTSILKYPEGSINNEFEILVQDLFPGLMELVHRTWARVVPSVVYRDYDNSKTFHILFGDPIDLSKYSNDSKALKDYRDLLGEMLFTLMKKYSYTVKEMI